MIYLLHRACLKICKCFRNSWINERFDQGYNSVYTIYLSCWQQRNFKKFLLKQGVNIKMTGITKQLKPCFLFTCVWCVMHIKKRHSFNCPIAPHFDTFDPSTLPFFTKLKNSPQLMIQLNFYYTSQTQRSEIHQLVKFRSNEG